jgi:type III pantothenate kinase
LLRVVLKPGTRQKLMSRPTDYLLVDISNSFTKIALASTGRVQRPVRIATSRLTSRFLRGILARHPVRRVVVCSVVPDRNREIKKAAGDARIIWLSSRVRLGVGIDYPLPASIGADRLANAAAVAVLHGTPAIVVDFGTAVTFDIVAANKTYIGGVIAPGLESMTNFLYQRTALLPKLSLREPRRAVGKSTIEAMRAGAIYGYRGLVREIIERIQEQEFGRRHVHVVATGGYARLISRKLPLIEKVDPNLTLQGLRIVGNLNA